MGVPPDKKKKIIQLYRLGMPNNEIYKRLGTSSRYTNMVVQEYQKECEQVTIFRLHDMVIEMMKLMRQIPGVPSSIVDQRLREIKEKYGDDHDLDK